MEEPRRRFAAMMSGLDIHYDLGEGHPLLGRACPISTWSAPTARCGFTLHDARPVQLNLGESGGFDITPWAGRVRRQIRWYVGASGTRGGPTDEPSLASGSPVESHLACAGGPSALRDTTPSR
jgi:hypothetical protein